MKNIKQLLEAIYRKGGKDVEISTSEKHSEENRRSQGIRISPRKSSVADFVKKSRKRSKRGLSVHRSKIKKLK